MNVIESAGLGKRYGRTWALHECDVSIPSGHIAALVGPNGAGKTTLLHLAVGLTTPTAGRISVLGGLTPGGPEALARVGFVAQDAALYANLTVAEMLRLTRHLNQRWDEAWARRRMSELGIPLARKLGKLSGGQRAQVSLVTALAKRPELLVLDEPVARLDPLARHEFMAALMTAVVNDGLSVVFSSHVVAELERVCDYLVVIAHGGVQAAGEVDGLLAGHRLFVGPAIDAPRVSARVRLVHRRFVGRQAHLLAQVNGSRPDLPDGWEAQTVGLEELILAYLRSPETVPAGSPSTLTEAVA